MQESSNKVRATFFVGEKVKRNVGKKVKGKVGRYNILH